MKKSLVYVTVLMLVTISCKKDQAENPNSEWIVDGVSYRGFGITHPAGSAFDASESTRSGISTGNFISINFNYNYMPKRSGIYPVKFQPNDSTQCSVTVQIVTVSGRPIRYTSVDSNSLVTINVSPGGKLAASFSNIILSYFSTGEIKMVSGKLEEK
ncbi:MAG: hypothetical protein ABIS74_16635 [Ferruginibacter sp.]